jgi:hypothetical protein
MDLELVILPDLNRGAGRASLKSLGLSRRWCEMRT